MSLDHASQILWAVSNVIALDILKHHAEVYGLLIYGRCNPEGQKSINCTETYHYVNCRETHPLCSRASGKWKLEKEIQTVRTKQNIAYPEARKIVESRTPIVGTFYAASTAQSSNRKTYRTIETQTDLPVRNVSELQKTTENINKTPKNLTWKQKNN